MDAAKLMEVLTPDEALGLRLGRPETDSAGDAVAPRWQAPAGEGSGA